ncbi:hypothetical protein PBY51_021106 [Eleginops maclovinus]|uniref:Uncharacterized protein n=1 Tax=Eleginops maclovinus TaxID=56733 RepID=A0AAN7XFB0_ELEMC|nr:hypothetical protein PBY51_021106 [Eleginops maclovinus]
MLEAAERTTELSVQTDPVCLFPPTLSPVEPQTGLCESHQLHQRAGLGSNIPPPPFPPETPSAHIHLTLPLSVFSNYHHPPKKNLLPVLSG